MSIQAPSGSQARTSPRRVTRSRGAVTGATSSSDPNPNWFGTVYARGSRGARWYIGRTSGTPSTAARWFIVCRYGTSRWRRRRALLIASRASRGYIHGSLTRNGLLDECSRRIGENTPYWTQRVASSSSRTPKMWPPTSWLHHPAPMFGAGAVGAPPAVADVRGGRGELGLEVQRVPGDVRVAGEADRVAMAARAGVAR